MGLTSEVFVDRGWLYPAEVGRGIKPRWQPKYYVVVSGDNWPETHDWAKENSSGLWIDHIYQPEYIVGFELEEDAVAFKLMWA